jgi:hypothetical protein
LRPTQDNPNTIEKSPWQGWQATSHALDKGTSRKPPQIIIPLIEGPALQTPPRLTATVHRQNTAIAKDQGWNPPGYHRVYTAIKGIAPDSKGHWFSGN